MSQDLLCLFGVGMSGCGHVFVFCIFIFSLWVILIIVTPVLKVKTTNSLAKCVLALAKGRNDEQQKQSPAVNIRNVVFLWNWLIQVQHLDGVWTIIRSFYALYFPDGKSLIWGEHTTFIPKVMLI